MRIPDAGDAVGNGDARQAVQLANALSPMLVTLLGMVKSPLAVWAAINTVPFLLSNSGPIEL